LISEGSEQTFDVEIFMSPKADLSDLDYDEPHKVAEGERIASPEMRHFSFSNVARRPRHMCHPHNDSCPLASTAARVPASRPVTLN